MYLPFTGRLSINATAFAVAVQLALDEAEGLPGGARLASVRLDHGALGSDFDPAAVVETAQTAVADQSVVAAYGPEISAVAAKAIPLFNAAGLALVSSTATAPGLTKGALGQSLRKARPAAPSFFRVCATNHAQAAIAAKLIRQMKIATAYVVDDSELFGVSLCDFFVSVFKTLGGTVLTRETTEVQQVDYGDLLSRVKAAAPGVVYFGGQPVQSGRFRAQMGQSGLVRIPFFGGTGLAEPQFRSSAGNFAENAYYTAVGPDLAHFRTEQAVRFIEAYRRRWRTDPSGLQAGAYASGHVIVAAIRRALEENDPSVSLREAVRRAMAATRDLPTAIGTVSFDSDGDIRNPYVSVYRYDENLDAKFINQRLVTEQDVSLTR